MSPPTVVTRQRDFSGGEIVEWAKRRDDTPLVRAGCRQLKNRRILATGATETRPGRSIKYADGPRIDQVRMSPTVTYDLCFSDGVLRIRDSSGAIVAAVGGMPWTNSTVGNIRWAVYGKEIFVCFTSMQPFIAAWDGSSTWSFAAFTFTTALSGLQRIPFYRFAAPNITMLVSAITGTVDVTFSSSVLTSDHVGVLFRWANRRLRIATVTNGTTGTATWIERGLPNESVHLSISNAGFDVGVVGESDANGATGIVTSLASTNNLHIQLTNYLTGMGASGNFVTPNAYGPIDANAGVVTPEAITLWDEEIMSTARGWPQSVAVDQNRLIFCDFEGAPEAIAWSAIGAPRDFEVTALATGAIVETLPGNGKHGRPRVYNVVGALSDEFVFTDQGVRYIPISVTNPLTPGSVAFNLISDDAASPVFPCVTSDGILYVNAAMSSISAIVGTGQSARPYIIRDPSEFHSHLFSDVSNIAVSTRAGDIPERYVYVLNGDGTLAVGKLNADKDWIGWVPWESGSDGAVSWISTLGSEVTFTTAYQFDGVNTRYLAESLDVDSWMDAAVLYNSIPSALATGTDSEITIAYWLGTTIGNMTAAGGIAAAADGTTSQAAAAAASKTGTTTSYVGKTLEQGMRIAKGIAYPSSDSGFASVTPVTVTLYGKTGSAPVSSSDGTALGTTGSIADTTSAQTITSSDTTTEYNHVWFEISSANGNHFMAEAVFYTPGLSRASFASGTGALWFLAGATAQVMDERYNMSTRVITAAGAATPIEGDDISGSAVMFGFAWEETIEPFIPHGREGQDVGQTFRKRNLGEVAVAVQNSQGFVIANRTVDPYNAGDITENDPTLREGVYTAPVMGSDFDPRVVWSKATPGPCRVLEISFKGEV